jgi:hypothetical protein
VKEARRWREDDDNERRETGDDRVRVRGEGEGVRREGGMAWSGFRVGGARTKARGAKRPEAEEAPCSGRVRVPGWRRKDEGEGREAPQG